MKALTFEVRSGQIVVTDPCYTKGTWCAVTVPAKNGKWFARINVVDEGQYGQRVAKITTWHEDAQPHAASLTHVSDNIGVDSGQAGFFDEAAYPNAEDETGDYGDLNTFYGRACAATADDTTQGGVVNWNDYDMGVVSASGYGDGSYALYGKMRAGSYVALEVVFIGDDE